jgi:parallel beta-helix repeat protein
MKLSLRSPKRLILLLLIGPFLSFTLSAQIIVANNNTSGAGSFAAALDNITAGQTITIPAGVTGVISVGALNVGTSCNIVSHANVVLDGGGAYKHGRPWLQNLLTIATSNVTITDLILTGATGTNAFDGSGILIADGQSNITFNNLDVSGSKNSGIASSAWVCLTCGNSLGTSDITINGCNVTNNGASGVVLSHSDNVIITGGTYDSNSQHGVYLNGDTYVAGVYVPTTDLANAVGVTNSSVTGVTSTNNGNGGLTIAGNSTGNVIDNCITNDNNEHGLWLRLASSNNTIQNCTSNNNGGGSLACGINVSLGGNLNNNILNNSCSGNQDYGIYLYDNYGIPNDNNLISGNTITTSGSHGIYVLNSTNTLVRSNTIHDNGTGINGGDGINFGNSSSGGEISANTLYSNIGDGVNITDGVLIPADGSDSNTVPILPGGSNNNDIFGNYVGILPDGTIGGNTLNGIKIDKSSGNQVGVNGRNFISGNDNHGIYLDEIPVGTQSIIRDNYIGTNLTGTAAEGNALSGIFLSNCKTVLIDDNLISGNLQDGIQLGNAATNISTDVVEIENNLIGTDVNGTLALPNSRYGINVDNATFVEIGDGTASGRNLVSANGQDGIYISNDAAFIDIDENYIGLDITGLADLGNGGNGVTMTGANNNKILNNYISGNTSNGIYVQSAATASNTIQSNFIGLLIDGSNGGNGADGINLDACKSNTIGGTLGNGNVIGWNTGDGISLNGNGTDDNIIGDNLIGIDGSDNLIPNGGNGIYIASTATSNEIGVNASGTSAGNIISGNTENGIIIDGSNNNKIDGNIIGMNSTKLAVLPNGGAFSGIHITGSGATLNVIGGVARNYIAGAHLQQILIDNGANINTVKNVDLGDAILGALAQSTGNAVLITGAGTDGNIIGGVLGTDGNNIFHSNNVAVLINNQASGNTVKSNVFEGVGASSPVSAIQVTDGHSNIIGGADATQGNVIKETSANAIVVDGTSDGNQVQFNYIGVDENELSQGPIKGHGILLSGAGVSNTIVNENVIGNLDDATKSAIYIDGVAAISTLYGNYVGITRNDLAVANAGNGVSVLNASDAVSVGTAGQNPNVISNNVGHGVEITDSDLSVIINNHIGTEVDGNAPAGNSGNGIHVGTGNTSINIEGNVIASNQLDGILIDATVA